MPHWEIITLLKEGGGEVEYVSHWFTLAAAAVGVAAIWEEGEEPGCK